MKKLGLLFLVLFCMASCSEKAIKTDPNSEAIEQQIDELLSKMTLREKAAQMLNIGIPSVLTGGYWDVRDSAVFHSDRFHEFISTLGVGSIHNTPGYPPSKEDWYRLVKEIQDSVLTHSRLGIPVLYGIDNIHGANYVNGSVIFPHQIALAATWNPVLSERIGAVTSYESRAASLPWNYNPNADIAANPLWGRYGESFGEDCLLVTEMTTAFIRGSQQLGLDHPESTAVCVKHFLGYGVGTNGKDRANAIIPESTLRQYFLPPFEAAIEAGAASIMLSSNAVNGIPCHINSYYINDILKGELGFDGVVISDFSDVEFLYEAHQVAADKKEATKLAVNAGLDMIMNPYSADIVDLITELVEEGEIATARIDDAVRRVLRLKYRLNLFENPYSDPEDYPEFGGPAHQELNYQTAAEAITLLKNENGILPLKTDKKVLVTGYAANSINVLNGAWSRSFLGQDTLFNDPSKLTPLKAIEKTLGKANTLYAMGTNYTEPLNIAKAVSLASQVDYIVACVGEIPATEKPSDIEELELPEAQQALIKALASTGKPIILVLVEGRPRIIREIEPLVDAVVQAYLPGQEGGRVISDLLFGEINPSGKLPYTYPKYSGSLFPYYHKKADIRDKNWGYDGFDPQYEFGTGLSYTQFEFSNLLLSADSLSLGESLNVSVDVTNKGNRTGKEVVQVYLSDLVAKTAPDVKKLVDFKKIAIQPGETHTIEFVLSGRDFSFVDRELEWITEPGQFRIAVGGNPDQMLITDFWYLNP
jgi:beta-glucosidase